MTDTDKLERQDRRLRRLEMSVACITNMLMGNPRLAKDATTKEFKKRYPELFEELIRLNEAVAIRSALK